MLAVDEDGTKYLRAKAEMLEELETSLPNWLRRPHWRVLPALTMPLSAFGTHRLLARCET
jgi:hypothetical protein